MGVTVNDTNTKIWFDYQTRNREQHPLAEAQAVVLQTKLVMTLATYANVKFDHIKIAHFNRRVAVFVVKGDQSTVLYDKTKGFPSVKLLASLTLLGSS
jgi:hypothetical protein